MKRHISKITSSQGVSWLGLTLLFSLLFCFLVAFNLSFADDPTEPSNPNLEHPWDDMFHEGSGKSSTAPPGTHATVILPLGVSLRIIVHMQPATQKLSMTAGKESAPKEKNRGHLFISIR